MFLFKVLNVFFLSNRSEVLISRSQALIGCAAPVGVAFAIPIQLNPFAHSLAFSMGDNNHDECMLLGRNIVLEVSRRKNRFIAKLSHALLGINKFLVQSTH